MRTGPVRDGNLVYCLNEVRPRRPEQSVTQGGGTLWREVSMKSGLEGRNNGRGRYTPRGIPHVSMKSGLEGRNNIKTSRPSLAGQKRLNEVRPRRPEQ